MRFFRRLRAASRLLRTGTLDDRDIAELLLPDAAQHPAMAICRLDGDYGLQAILIADITVFPQEVIDDAIVTMAAEIDRELRRRGLAGPEYDPDRGD